MGTQVNAKKRRFRWLKWGSWGVVLSALVTAGFVIQSGLIQSERKAEGIYNRVSAAGTPLSVDAFEASIQVPYDENSAHELVPALKAYEKVLDALKREERDALNQFKSDDLKDPQKKALLDVALNKMEPYWQDVVKATGKPHFVPDLDWSEPLETSFEHYSQIRRVSKHAVVRAQIHAANGNTQAAIDELDRVNAWSSYITDIPIFIGVQIEMALRNIRTAAVEECIRVDPSQASTYRTYLMDESFKPVGRAVRTEAMFMVAIMRHLTMKHYKNIILSEPRKWMEEHLSIGGRTDPMDYYVGTMQKVDHNVFPSDPFARASIARLLEVMEPVLNTLNADGTEKSPGALEAALEQASNRSQIGSSPMDYAVQEVLPVFEHAFQAPIRMKARLRTTRAMASVIDYQAKNGRWPSDLSEVGPVPLDPFLENKPIQYRVENNGFRVWSVGVDKVDNGGITRAESKPAAGSEQKFDEVIIYTEKKRA